MGDRKRRDPRASVATGEGERLALLMAVDDGYFVPLAVCVASMLEHLSPGVAIDLFLISTGLAGAQLSRLETWWGDRVALRELVVPPERLNPVRDLVGGQAVQAHLRALLGSTLPAGVSKVLYLDADILVQRDLSEVWRQEMRGNIVLAVQDTYIQELPDYCRSPGAAVGASRPYFNSGVMIIDVDAWRADGVEAAYHQELRRLGARSRWADQDALNACLVGRWGALPPKWNRQFALSLYPDWRCSPHSEEEFREARSSPGIVHFCTRTKPWHQFCDHPKSDVLRFRSWLGRLPLDGGRRVPPTLFERTRERLAAPHRRLLDSVAAAFRSRERRHALSVMLPAILRLGAGHPWTLLSVPVSVLQDLVALRHNAAR